MPAPTPTSTTLKESRKLAPPQLERKVPVPRRGSNAAAPRLRRPAHRLCPGPPQSSRLSRAVLGCACKRHLVPRLQEPELLGPRSLREESDPDADRGRVATLREQKGRSSSVTAKTKSKHRRHLTSAAPPRHAACPLAASAAFSSAPLLSGLPTTDWLPRLRHCATIGRGQLPISCMGGRGSEKLRLG